MTLFWGAYLPPESGGQRNEITAPLRAPLQDLRALPPALVIVDENDVLRERARPTARNLPRQECPSQASVTTGSTTTP